MVSGMSGGPRPPHAKAKRSASLSRGYRIIALEGISGSGKTAVSKAVERELNGRFATLRTRLSIQVERVFHDMIDVVPGGPADYRDMIPGSINVFASVVDAALQFRYLSDLYNRHDIVIFDGWLPAYHVRCAEAAHVNARIPDLLTVQHRPGVTWCRKFMDMIPEPDIIFYLKADPRAAALRVAHQGNAAVRKLSKAKLLADLTRLDARYREAMTIWPGHIADGNAPLPQVVDAVLDRIGDLLQPTLASAGTSPHTACPVRPAGRAGLAWRGSAQYPRRPGAPR